MPKPLTIPFNKPYISTKCNDYMLKAYRSGKHCGNYDWTNKSIQLIKEKYNTSEIFLVPSCTAALEMGAMLAGLKPGDEVILPSYTFSSTVTSIMLFGARPIFCDINPSTMNIDVNQIKPLITNKTKLLLPIDYAGVPCELDKIKEISNKYSIPVLVDSAQSFGSLDSNSKWCSSEADLIAFSFHETKNISCGEGGALVVNNKEWIERAYILQEKGTDRRNVLQGKLSKYHWVDYGSSYLLSDILASILCGQLEDEKTIMSSRANVTQLYSEILRKFENQVNVIDESQKDKYNHHAYYIVFESHQKRNYFISLLQQDFKVSAYVGYSPLHSSPMGLKLGYKPSDLPVTQDLANRIVRLPIYTELGQSNNQLEYLKYAIETTLLSVLK
ncbi:dTDP-4-amino-4,6-dideoxygalactose transaminase [Prochlorococcus sp. MIT 1341]|uniref:dTDP-4-amino-4,6-dideoxygalactose transaminase n=1 Tax=Prochlorococcus sp. MIT 1341 TaxID=3096221 RepID=UPI002A74B9A1|nr:dTDP-4-amino-4,6-dideoxygalactose transaminase [Prochlorococcus sp. MIT 1341]